MIGRSAKRHFFSFGSYASGSARPDEVADRPRDHVVVAHQVGLVLRLREGSGQRAGEVAGDGRLLGDDEGLAHRASHDTQIGSHTATGWWLEEAGEVDPRPPLERLPGRRRRGDRRRLHRHVDRLARCSRRSADGGPAGGRRLRPRAERAQRRLLRVAVAVGAARCASASATSPRARCSTPSSAACREIGDWCEAEGVDAWFDQSGYMCVSTAPAFDDVGLRGGRGRRRARRARARAGADRPSRCARAAPRRVFRRGVFDPRLRDAAAGAAGARPAPRG